MFTFMKINCFCRKQHPSHHLSATIPDNFRCAQHVMLHSELVVFTKWRKWILSDSAICSGVGFWEVLHQLQWKGVACRNPSMRS